MKLKRVTMVLGGLAIGLASLGCSFKKDKAADPLAFGGGSGTTAYGGGSNRGGNGGAGMTPSSTDPRATGSASGPRQPAIAGNGAPTGTARPPAPPQPGAPSIVGPPYEASGNLRNPSVPVPPRVTGNARVTLSQASVGAPYIAMTFDDGPHPSNTPRLLDLLRQRNIKATFYVVGTNARRYPEIMRRIVAEGHEIGNHTVNHVGLTKLSDDKIRQELRGAHDAIVQATGVAPLTVRPPYGAVNSRQKQWIHDEFGYTTVLWSVDPRDWQRPGVGVVSRRLVEGARPGAVLLAHDIHPPTIEAMPPTLDELLRRGFQFVTVSQLMALESVGAMGPPQVSSVEPDDADAASPSVAAGPDAASGSGIDG